MDFNRFFKSLNEIKRKGAVTQTQVVVIAVISSLIIAGGAIWYMGKSPTLGQITKITGSKAIGDINCNIASTTIRAVVRDAITGANADINAEVYTADNSEESSNTEVNGAGSATTTFPTQTAGYVIFGNDNYQSTTDRGAEYWYAKSDFPNVGCSGTLKEPINANLFAESTGTSMYTYFESGTSETPANITLGANDDNSNSKVWITAPNDQSVGIPFITQSDDFKKLGLDSNRDSGVGLCLNQSLSGTITQWEVLDSFSTFTPPENFTSLQMVSPCYVIPQSAIQPYKYTDSNGNAKTVTDAIVDNKRAEVSIRLVTGATNPGIAGYNETLMIVPLCYARDSDQGGKWTLGWMDTERQAEDRQCGFSIPATALVINNA